MYAYSWLVISICTLYSELCTLMIRLVFLHTGKNPGIDRKPQSAIY